jgi:hypothetical protein
MEVRMRSTSRRINFLIDENVSKDLAELVPVGKRSQVVNDALRKELEIIRRKKVVNRLTAKRATGKSLTTREIVSALGKDRSKQG